jgi:hypothetical protein
MKELTVYEGTKNELFNFTLQKMFKAICPSAPSLKPLVEGVLKDKIRGIIEKSLEEGVRLIKIPFIDFDSIVNKSHVVRYLCLYVIDDDQCIKDDTKCDEEFLESLK